MIGIYPARGFSPAKGNSSPLKLLAAISLLTLTATAADRPKIGLALEGGGAIGFAHMGVLEYFEKTTFRSTTLPAPAWAA